MVIRPHTNMISYRDLKPDITGITSAVAVNLAYRLQIHQNIIPIYKKLCNVDN